MPSSWKVCRGQGIGSGLHCLLNCWATMLALVALRHPPASCFHLSTCLTTCSTALQA